MDKHGFALWALREKGQGTEGYLLQNGCNDGGLGVAYLEKTLKSREG